MASDGAMQDTILSGKKTAIRITKIIHVKPKINERFRTVPILLKKTDLCHNGTVNMRRGCKAITRYDP